MADLSVGLGARKPLNPQRLLLSLWNGPVLRALRMAVAVGGWRSPVVAALLIGEIGRAHV